MVSPMASLRTIFVVALAACGTVALPAVAAAKPKVRAIKVLVTNDDGVAGAGMSAMVDALRREPKVTITVVAPVNNKTGSGGKTTDGTVTAVETTLPNGFPAIGVNGYPADAVNYALANTMAGDKRPDLVMSGINYGANIGPFVGISGTVGAARAGAAQGIPALATSQGIADPMAWQAGVKQTIAWFRLNRSNLKKGTVWNLNIPSCSKGKVRGTVKVRKTADRFYDFDPFGTVDCAVRSRPLQNDVTAYYAGFAPLQSIGQAR